MLADFCHELWETRIDSDVVSSDGYEVTNLISRDKKAKGFLAARFVKPVVTVLLSFPFPVDLYAININPQVGAQNTSGLEILAASLKPINTMKAEAKETSTRDKEIRQESKRYCSRLRTLAIDNHRREISGFHHYQYDLNINNIRREFKSLFVQVLRVRIPEGSIGHFVNPCLKHSPNVHCDSRILRNASGKVHKCMLQHGQLLCCVTHLVVRITQVHKGSVPCLGAVEVFGQPAQNSGTFVMNYMRIITSRLKEEKKEVCNGFFEVLTPAEDLDGQSPCTAITSERSEQVSSKEVGSSPLTDHVPEDFIDPITLNIMTLPVLLPSGTTIDNTTLERHINSEKSWGRPPSDPFTGLPLGSKVVPNAALKFRIDNFLLSSKVHVGNLGRTVGSISDYKNATKLRFNTIKEGNVMEKNYPLHKFPGKSTRNPLGDEDKDQPSLKRKKTGVNSCNSRVSDSLDHALEEALRIRRQPAVCNQNVSVSSLVRSFGSKCNESNLDNANSREPRNCEDGTCNGCPHLEENRPMFQLPCQHVVCRACLSSGVENKQCPNCKKTFDRKNVSRVHSIKIQTL